MPEKFLDTSRWWRGANGLSHCHTRTVETHLCGVFVYRYYSDIHSAASGCYQEMNSTLTELSGVSEHTKHLNMLL